MRRQLKLKSRRRSRSRGRYPKRKSPKRSRRRSRSRRRKSPVRSRRRPVYQSIYRNRPQKTFRFGFGSQGGVWTIFTLEGCPACVNVKKMMDEKGLQYRTLDGPSNTHMWEKTAVRDGKPYDYYPKIYDPNGIFIGGTRDFTDSY